MDKQTFGSYGWIVITVVVLAIMIAFSTPFGKFIVGGAQDALGNLTDAGDNGWENAENLIADITGGGAGNGGNGGAGEATHTCADGDGNHVCDECLEVMPELCIDDDSDHECDECFELMPWTSLDADGDLWCDCCDMPKCAGYTGEHFDNDSDYNCDACQDYWYCLNEDFCADENGDGICDYYPHEY